jgi:hypothetical protein
MNESGTSPTIQWDFFLAHAKEDGQIAEQLYYLLAPYARVFLDTKTLRLGRPWDAQIAGAQAASNTTVALISAHSANAQNQRVEIQRAISMTRQPNSTHRLVPVFLEGFGAIGEMPYGVELYQGLHLDPSGLGAVADSLLEMVQNPDVSAAFAITRTLLPTSLQPSKLRLTVHRAFFAGSGVECFFVNAANLAYDRDLEITHVWFETNPEVHVTRPDRPLPKRLKPQESWETWVSVFQVPAESHEQAYTLARARLSSGEIVKSVRDEDVPKLGTVPGGPILSG